MDPIKVVIIQDYNTPYRNGLFNAINDIKDIELFLVYVGKRTKDRMWEEKLVSHFKEYFISVKVTESTFTENTLKIDYFELLATINKIKADVIITQIGKTSMVLNLLKIFRKTEFIYWNESTKITTNGRKINWKYRIFRPTFKAFLSTGAMADDYLRHVGFKLNEKNCFRAPNSVDKIFSITEGELERKFNDSEIIRVLFVGSFILLKGFDLLQSAIIKLNGMHLNKRIEFHFAGAGDLEVIKSSNIINHGFISKEKSLELYKKCHALILPSLWDCNPLVAIEAAKCGNVLLLSDGVGNYPELVKNNGYTFKRNNVDEIVAVLLKVISLNNSELIQMGRNSLKNTELISHTNSATTFGNTIRYSLKK